MIEIERKFLVKSTDFKSLAIKETLIIQGFLSQDPERTVRVRIKGSSGFLTIKGKSNSSGTSRYEWEHKISISEAEDLLKLCLKGIIKKTRFEIPLGQHIYEVDEFYDDNDGLVIAEIELNSETEFFEKPEWLGKEVTGKPEYYNSQLSINPYSTWK